MIIKNKSDYSFVINGNDGKLIIEPNYSIEYQGASVPFSTLKELHVFINTITDIVDTVDDGLRARSL